MSILRKCKEFCSKYYLLIVEKQCAMTVSQWVKGASQLRSRNSRATVANLYREGRVLFNYNINESICLYIDLLQ